MYDMAGKPASAAGGFTAIDLTNADSSQAGNGSPTWGALSLTSDATQTTTVSTMPAQLFDLGAAADGFKGGVISVDVEGFAFSGASAKVGIGFGLWVNGSTSDAYTMVVHQDNATATTYNYGGVADNGTPSFAGNQLDVDITSAAKLRVTFILDSRGELKIVYVTLKRGSAADDRTFNVTPAKSFGTGSNLFLAITGTVDSGASGSPGWSATVIRRFAEAA